ncbi:MAG: hypothetical protein A2X23_00020 [Chloroflexi bacterium GWC2_73_18]|nr:MAG: hypothetical protein A2X23_00020 [Chloroflexi bacterium GWC2_73_18]
MQRNDRSTSLVLVLILAGLAVAACSPSSKGAVLAEPAVLVEEIEGTDLSRLTLSPKAAGRLGIETAPVSEEEVGGARRMVIPYAAVLYDADGNAWAYTNPEGLVFIRHAITVESVDGDRALLSDGPPVGTLVVTVGVAELHGVETGVGGGH